jgi:hypothetical protein
MSKNPKVIDVQKDFMKTIGQNKMVLNNGFEIWE